MGQEILYCSKCQTRLVGADFEKGQAFRIAVTSDPLCIGHKREGAPPVDMFVGFLDEVRIYDRALTAEDVAALARAPE